MKIRIDIELEERDLPTYTNRLTQLFATLLADNATGQLFKEYAVVYPESDFKQCPPSTTYASVYVVEESE